MKKILGIIGSPRKLGNCEIFSKEVSRHIPEPHELQLLRLADFDIQSCRGCYRCLAGEEQCVLKDDIYQIVDVLCAADGLIVAAPTYFLGANAALKRFIDRAFCLYSRIDAMCGKPSVGVCIAGIQGKEGHGLLGVENFLKIAMTDIKMTRVIYGAMPGEIFLNEENRTSAKQMGKALFGPASVSTVPRCPVCGGNTFRFLGSTDVRCMLCSNQGTLDTSSGQPVLKITCSGHDFLSSKADVLNHKAWLLGMKNRFGELKNELKAISLDYRKDGNWITPE